MQNPTSYPEHDKLHKVKDQSQACHDFLEWLQDKHGFSLAYYHKHGPDCPGWDEGRQRVNHRSPPPHCEYQENVMYSATYNLQRLLAEFFEIDLKKLDAEKEAMLAKIRSK